jgi:prevent-host-death family protein
MAEQVGIRELRANVATLVRRAGAGERIVLTVAGQPVAQLGPLDPLDSSPTLEDLAARGLVVMARRTDRPEPELNLPLTAGTRLDKLAREVRGR